MRRRQFTLRSLMIFVTLACVLLTAWHFLVERPRQVRVRKWATFNAMFAKGCDLKFHSPDKAYKVFFKNKNVTDADLEQFIPAFVPKGQLSGMPSIRRLDLNGSAVSPESVKAFEEATGIEIDLGSGG